MEEDIARVSEEIANIIGEGANRKEIEKSLKRYLDLGIDLKSARDVILKKHGVKGKGVSSAEIELKELEGGEQNISLTVKVLGVNEKNIKVGGAARTIFHGLIADRSGIRPFTTWEDFHLESGKTYRIEGAYTKLYRGEVEVNLGNLAEVFVQEGKLEDLDVKSLPRFGSSKEVKISQITPNMGNISITGKVVSTGEKEVNVGGEVKKIQEGIIGDDTGTIRFTIWGNGRFQEGDVIRVQGAYVKGWKGIPQLNIDERCTITNLDKEINVKKEGGNFRSISDLTKRGETDMTAEGCIVEVREGSGLIFRCPICQRVLRDGVCMVHGKQQGYPDLRIKAVFDDGYGSATIILNKEITERIMGKGLEDIVEEVERRGETLYLEEEIGKNILGHWYRVKGTSILDDFGPTILPKDIHELDGDVKEEVKKLLNEVREAVL